MISRRTFIQRAAAGAASWPLLRQARPWAAPSPEILYNGIRLGSPWPPRLQYADDFPVLPPYLADPPSVVPIDVGRQLFVDDFLIEQTTLTRTFHHPEYHPATPVLRPETAWEMRDDYADRTKTPPNPAAMVFSDGVFYDPQDRLFKMWYMAGYLMFTCLATSTDGIHWERPALDVEPGTNIVTTGHRDSSTVWLDLLEPDPARRYKMSLWDDHHLLLHVSPDGVHWTEIGRTGQTGDRSTFFHNPFRRQWCFSLRADQFDTQVSGRFRRYFETPDFAAAADWTRTPPVAWVKADSRDFARPALDAVPELYNLDCVAYESLVLGLFTIWRGESRTREKINEVTVGFSRDGFHWHRPDRSTFLPVSDEPGSWNWANVQSAGGGCLVVGDYLYFYVSGRQGRPGTNEPGICSTGLAVLRRDGFASMDWRTEDAAVHRRGAGGVGTLLTRPVRFTGGHLFVNAELGDGELRAEVCDPRGRVIAPFEASRCRPVSGDGTRLALSWPGASLADLAGETVRFRFSLTRGRLYAFWVSPSPSGHSRGYPAAGGPEFAGPIDDGGAA